MESLKLQPLSYLIVIVISIFLLHEVAKIVDYLKQEGLSMRRRWSLFMDWRVFALCLPLLITLYSQNAGTLEDGTHYTKHFNYGDQASLLLYFMAVLTIGLFRFVTEFYSQHPKIKHT